MRLIDVSNFQGTPDWKKVAASGVKGAWLKATEGVTYTDPTFIRDRNQATAARIHVGAYHFAHPERNTPEAEAAHFVNTVATLGRRDLRPVLDYEVTTTLVPAAQLKWIQAFNRAVKNGLGVWPVFYSYPALVAHLNLKAPVGAGLWLASYGANDGRQHSVAIPSPWKKIVAQQFTSVGSVPGIAGKVDLTEAASLLPLLAHPALGLL